MIGPDLVGLELGPVEHRWSASDAILYALGIGARHPRDLELLYERASPNGPRAAPTFALTACTLMLGPLVDALSIDLRHLLHAGQGFEINRVPPARGECLVQRRVVGVSDKGRAAIVECEDLVTDAYGTLASGRSQWWIDGAGGFGGVRDAGGTDAALLLPDRPADVQVSSTTSSEQAALYRLSGDLNPVHVDPQFARAAGQPRAFLHGLCTFGWLASSIAPPGRPGGSNRWLPGSPHRCSREMSCLSKRGGRDSRQSPPSTAVAAWCSGPQARSGPVHVERLCGSWRTPWSSALAGTSRLGRCT